MTDKQKVVDGLTALGYRLNSWHPSNGYEARVMGHRPECRHLYVEGDRIWFHEGPVGMLTNSARHMIECAERLKTQRPTP